MELAHRLAIDTLRASITLGRSEANRLGALIENGATPEIRLWAKGDLEKLEKRIQAQAEEMAQLESE